MYSHNEILTVYLGFNDQLQIEVDVDFFIAPGQKSLDYYEPDDPDELQIERFSISRVICISANGEETVLPDEFLERWEGLIWPKVVEVVYNSEDELYRLGSL